MTSEEKHGIVPQPAETCPIVDEVLSEIRDAEQHLQGWEHMALDDLKNAADYAEWYLDQARDALERVRESNIDLREWGQEWKRLAKSLDDSRKVLIA